MLQILLCAALTLLLLGLGWGLRAVCLLPVTGKQLCMVLSARGDGESLEQQCRAYLLLRSFGLLRRPLVLVDAGLSEQGLRLAELLSGQDENILLCKPQELLQILHNGA